VKENRLRTACRVYDRGHDIGRCHSFTTFGESCSSNGTDRIAAVEYQEAIHLDPLLEDAYRNRGFLAMNLTQLVPLGSRTVLHAVELSPTIRLCPLLSWKRGAVLHNMSNFFTIGTFPSTAARGTSFPLIQLATAILPALVASMIPQIS